MNIIYISKYAVFPEYGSGTRQYFLSKYLAEMGNEVMVITSRSSTGVVPEFDGLSVERTEGNLKKVTMNGPDIETGFNLKRLWSWLIFETNLFKYRSKIKTFKPDIVIVSSLSILTFLYGIFLKRWLKIPLVLEVRDIYPLTLTEVGGYSKYHPAVLFLGWVERVGYKNADLILSTLPNAKEHIKNIAAKDFNYKWLPMGIDPAYYKDAGSDIVSEGAFEREEGAFYACYVGTMGLVDSLETIFEVAEQLEETHPAIRFVFIGKGPLKAHFQEKYKNKPNVIIKDAISKRALLYFLQSMDVMILNLKDLPIYRYGISPNKWMDYMFAKKPVLNAYSGYRSVIDEANCGIFVAAENVEEIKKGILELYNMPKSELNQMGQNGYDYLLKHLDYKILAEDLYKSLEALVDKAKFEQTL